MERAWYPNGQIRISIEYKDGYKHGIDVSWTQLGQLTKPDHYVYDVKSDNRNANVISNTTTITNNGNNNTPKLYKKTIVTRYPDGNKKMEETYNDRNLELVYEWYMNGISKSMKEYRDDKPHGKWQEWYPSGKTKRC